MATILVVDDEASIRKLVEAYLAEGYTALRGRRVHGLAVFRRYPPDLVILDIMLPGMDGLEVLQQIAAIEAYVLLLTSRSEELTGSSA
jgi:two-component system alkaline phosphatase synthesis response regulator PhoP